MTRKGHTRGEKDNYVIRNNLLSNEANMNAKVQKNINRI